MRKYVFTANLTTLSPTEIPEHGAISLRSVFISCWNFNVVSAQLTEKQTIKWHPGASLLLTDIKYV